MEAIYATKMSASKQGSPVGDKIIEQRHTRSEIISRAEEVLAKKQLADYAELKEVGTRGKVGETTVYGYVDKSGKKVDFTDTLKFKAAIAALNVNGHFFEAAPINSMALYSVAQLRRIFNTSSGLMLIVAAGLVIGMMSKPAVQVDEGLDSIGSVGDRGMLSQSSQVNVYQISDRYFLNIDPAAKKQLGEQTFNEVTMFFHTAKKAIETKNMKTLMAHYSDNYRDGDLDKKSVEQAWQRIFARVDSLATLNNLKLVKMSADRDMVVLQSDGLLVGVPNNEKGPVTIDNWNKQDHILVKEGGVWKLIGIYGPERKRLWFDKPMHPLV